MNINNNCENKYFIFKINILSVTIQKKGKSNDKLDVRIKYKNITLSSPISFDKYH